ncbi:hypothetical protein EHQ24_08100 [Leptospira noumeaensis]|uniref:Uncharacterized protein n=1 Tax=Leptospira noumeaensis TaxID=2484964 RepID=A0A4R9I944_9LEPT|nr:hypothetical protein [Leptospira noumeaensis]TGK82976.1 hypothetical protein EHQ24_08100 [Leptospira noumeaensis]
MRKEPNPDSISLGLIQGGSEVQIIQYGEKTTIINGIKGKWIYIKGVDTNLGSEIHGYIFDQFILKNHKTPSDILEKILEEKDDNIKLSKLQNFKNLFPFDIYREKEFGQHVVVDSYIEFTKCEMIRNRKKYDHSNQNEFFAKLNSTIKNFHFDEFEKLTKCEFELRQRCYQVEEDLNFPIRTYDNEIKEEIRTIFSQILIDTRDENNCYRMKSGKKYCFHIDKKNKQYQISGMCYK